MELGGGGGGEFWWASWCVDFDAEMLSPVHVYWVLVLCE
jgi:hypothetical protein